MEFKICKQDRDKQNNLGIIDFLYNEDEEFSICDNKYKKHLCSHAQTCKFKKNKDSIDYCIHTETCEFFCQKFISFNNIKTKDYYLHYEEALLAKKEKRLRN